MSKKIVKRIILSTAIILVALVLWIGIDVVIGLSHKNAPRKTTEVLDVAGVNRLIWVYSNKDAQHPDISYNYNTITSDIVLDEMADSIKFINSRFDCSDFRAIDLLKLYYVGGEEMRNLSPLIPERIRDTLTGFKFWITSEGKDSMCYHSENHEALFAVVEYLSGSIYPDSIFTIDGKTGTEHKEIARTRMLTWLKLRYDYGFSEYYSSNYYPVDLAALGMLMQYGDRNDTELMTKAAIITDLILYGYASQLFDYTFISANGRAYDRNNASPYPDAGSVAIINYIWEQEGTDFELMIGGHDSLFIDMLKAVNPDDGQPYYEIPQIIIEIGNDTNKTIKSSDGLDCSELAAEDLLGLSDRQLMYVLGMGAKTNPEVIETLLDIMNEYDLWSNDFLSSFKYINIKLFRVLGIMPYLMETFRPSTSGSAIQRGNIYTYITPDYKISTNQAYHPGDYGDQNTLSIATLPGGVTVFTTHPSRDDKIGTTPGYWAGFGMAPHSAQDENILLSVHNIKPGKILLAEDDTPEYTHTLFPEELFDEVIIDGKYAFGRIGNSYISLIGRYDFQFKPYDQAQVDNMKLPVSDSTKSFDLVQHGIKQFTIYELGSLSEDGTFQDFMARIRANTVVFNEDDMKLSYLSAGKSYELSFKGDFLINSDVIDLQYKRFESKYIVAERKAATFSFNYNSYSLDHNFENSERIYN